MKESFVFYLSWADQVDKLNTEQKAAFLDGIIACARGDEFETDDLAVDILVDLASGQMGRDAEKYEEIRKKRAEYGRRGAQAKAKFAEAKQANAKNDLANVSKGLAKQAEYVYVYDNDNVNVNDTDNENVNVNVNGNGGGNVNVSSDNTTTAAPTLGEISVYFVRIGSKADPQKFYDYYGEEALANMDWKAKAEEWKKTQYQRQNSTERILQEWLKESQENSSET